MKCNNCGTENKEKTKFCENCGKPIAKKTNVSTILSIIGIFYFLFTFIFLYMIEEELFFKFLFIGSYALNEIGGCVLGPILATLPFLIIGMILLLVSIISISKRRKILSKLDINVVLHIIVIILLLINFVMFYNYFASNNLSCIGIK